ncbi:MAG: DUF4381 domain-containing protein [Xanthomonadales bacterium]|nr:DUF4381 domain-containing protein [Xanthomonadales bacterium]
MQATELPVLPLRDIKLPPEPGFWPLAPGWWILLALIAVLLLWLLFKWVAHLRKKRRWQAIEQQLSSIEFAYQQHQSKQQLLTELSVFLRRFVKFYLQQDIAASYRNHHWIEHLNQLAGKPTFSPYATALTQGVYQADHDCDVNGLLSATSEFIHQQVMKPSKTKKTAKLEVQDV